jgi:NADH-quinone oxidoreductase subunit J
MVMWWVLAAAAVACAVGMLSVKNPVHSALLLVGNFVAVAVIYLMLSAPMLFAIQLIVYAGAIMVLFLFVIMFFMAPRARQWLTPPLRGQLVFGGAAVVAFMVLLFVGLAGLQPGPDLGAPVDQQQLQAELRGDGQPDAGLGTPRALGIWMFSYHVLPFNVIGILLLAALVGAVMVGRDRVSEGRSHVAEFAPHIDRVLPRTIPAGGERGDGGGPRAAEEVEA